MSQLRFAVTENFLTLLIYTICICVFVLHVIILICWLILLFNSSIKLRKKLKYLTTTIHTSDTATDILNSQVEYRKNLFMFAIVMFEFISSILIIISSIQEIVAKINEYVNLHKHNMTNKIRLQDNNSTISPHDLSINFKYEMSFQYRLIEVAFEMPLIFVITLVYTLMSYYVMVAKKSLNYLSDLKSVELEREQKFFLILSSIACVFLLLLLVRIEVFMLHYILEVLIVTVQLYLTRKFRARLVCVMKWKILDTRIAFGTNHYQFKSYTDILRKFKLFTLFYISFLVLFYFRLIFRTILAIAETIELEELYRIYKFATVLNTTEGTALNFAMDAFYVIEQVSLSISFLCLFFLNLFTLPYLLSKINISFHCNCKLFCFK